MAIWLFVFPTQAGCIERLTISSPYTRQAPGPNGQPVLQPDPVSTLGWAKQLPYPFPPGNPGFRCLNMQASTNPQQPDLLCIQIAEPAVSRQMVNAGAPMGAPVGNAGAPLTPPPMPGPQVPVQPGVVPNDRYVQLPDAALPGSADEMFAEAAAGGTYSDIDRFGNETLRPQDMTIISGPPVQQR
jgi:hypothetical protein